MDPVCAGIPESESTIPADVLELYRAAHYSFHSDEGHIDLRIGQACPKLGPLLDKYPVPTAVCITAYNPLGQEVSPTENLLASEELRCELERRRCAFWPAMGEDPQGTWSEPGFIVFGLSCTAAVELGNRFRQNAIVWVGPDTVPKLLLLR